MATSYSTSVSTSGLDAISQIAEQYMTQQYAWGQQQFANNTQLTDQVVGDAMNLYGSLSGVGGQLMSDYSKYFQPEYQSLVTDANNYASTARIQQAMGAAESGVSQSFNGQRNAALADLQSFGIDPSSGRYAQLDAAERTQQAAAQAGAGFQAEQATEATGRGLRSEALQLGSVMPSQATAAYNAAGQAATAAENAQLANSQEGVNMMGAPNVWGGIGQQLRKANSASMSSSPPPPPKDQSGNSGNSGNAASRSQGPDPLDEHESAAQADPNWAGTGGSAGSQGGGGGGGYTQPGPEIKTAGGGSSSENNDVLTQGGGGGGSTYDPTTDEYSGLPAGGLPTSSEGSGYDPTSDEYQGMSGGSQTPAAGSTYDPTSDEFQGSGTSGGDTNSDQSGGSGGSFGNSGDFENASSSSDDSGGGGGDDSGFATGGAIPYSKSPSHGRHVDDVRAKLNGSGDDIRLNAGEFVIPRHTVAWKGEKFFQDLIRKSKHERAGAGARPTMKPALPHRGAIPTSQGAYHG